MKKDQKKSEPPEEVVAQDAVLQEQIEDTVAEGTIEQEIERRK